MTFPDLNLAAAVHLLFLAGWASALLLVDLWIPKTHKTVTGWLAFAGLAIALVLVSAQQGSRQAAFGGTLATDGFSTLMNFIFIGAGMLSVLMALNYLRQHDLERGEFYPLLLFSIVGMMAMGMAKDLIIVFLSLELLSIPLYVLAGFGRPRIESEEAGLKYFLLGAFSSAFLVYGIALVYGATQATSFAGIGVALDAGRAGSPLLLAVEKPERMTTDVADYAGLGRTQPALAAAMTLFMQSLTGLPPSIGFVAKFYVFRAALEAGRTWLVLLGVVTVLVSAYYYLRVIVVMCMKEGLGEAVLPRALNFTVWFTAAGTLVFGIVPDPLMRFVESSVSGIF